MSVDGVSSSIPLRLAGAPLRAQRSTHAARPEGPANPTAGAPVANAPRTGRLVAAVVPGAVDFSGAAPTPRASSIPMYRRPADQNVAATGVHAGRLIDFSA